MKKILIAVLLLVLVFTLCACGDKDGQVIINNGNDASKSNSSSNETPNSNTAPETNTNSNTPAPADGNALYFYGVNVFPGLEYDKDGLAEHDPSVFTVESCAFEGKDTVYIFPDIEITVANVDGKDIIYMVNFTSPDAKTTEGIGLTDSKEAMIKAQGKDYTETMTLCSYDKGTATLDIIIEDNAVASVKYIMKVE